MRWYLRISRRAFAPGRNFRFFFSGGVEDEEDDVAGLAAPVDFRAICRLRGLLTLAFLVGVELFRPRRSGLVVSPLGGPPEAAAEELLDEEGILWRRL